MPFAKKSKSKTANYGKVKVVKRKDGSVKKTVRVTPEGYKEKVKTSKSGRVRTKGKDTGEKFKTVEKGGKTLKSKNKTRSTKALPAKSNMKVKSKATKSGTTRTKRKSRGKKF